MKKIAVLSDIHGNSWALQKVLDDATQKDIDTIFNLGDSLYGPLDPQGTYNLLKEYNIHHISGNEDRIIIENANKKTTNPTLAYVRDAIDNETANWLHTLPQTKTIDDFFLCHGTPTQDDGYLIEHVTKNGVRLKTKIELQAQLNSIKQPIICCGHSHTPHHIAVDSKHIINPGSVGLQAYDDSTPYYHTMENNHNNACYTIITKNQKNYTFEFIKLDYDYKKAVQFAEKNNRADWADWLRFGTVSKPSVNK